MPVLLGLARSLPPSFLLGVGSTSTSLVDYPKTGAVTVGDYYVDINNGSDSNNGTSLETPFQTIQTALSAASAGDTILVRAGVYPLSSVLNISKSINLYGFGTERPILDREFGGATTNETAYGIRINNGVSHAHIKGFELIRVPERTDALHACHAILNRGSNCKIEDIWINNSRTGSIVSNTGDNNIVQDCVIWNCRQLVLPANPTNVWDGISGTHTSQATNYINNLSIVRCVVANAMDDGYDLWSANNSRIIDSVAIGSGYFMDGGSGSGDGGGFKMGGSVSGAGGNTLQGSIAIGCRQTGIVSNSTKGAANTFLNNTSVYNQRGMITDSDTNIPSIKNTISLYNPTYNQSVNSSGHSFNTWNLSITDAGFASPTGFDYSLATGSAAIGSGEGGVNLGASDVALELAKTWLAHPEVYAARIPMPPQTKTFRLASNAEGAYAVATTTTPDTLIEWNRGVDVGNNLTVGSYSAGYGAMRAYLRFQVDVPQNAEVESVILRTYINTVDTWAAWDSSVALKDDTDAGFPVNLAEASSYITSSFIPVGGTSPILTVGWQEWELDVTAFTALFGESGWSGGNSLGLLIHQDPVTIGGAYTIEVADDELRPELEIRYST